MSRLFVCVEGGHSSLKVTSPSKVEDIIKALVESDPVHNSKYLVNLDNYQFFYRQDGGLTIPVKIDDMLEFSDSDLRYTDECFYVYPSYESIKIKVSVFLTGSAFNSKIRVTYDVNVPIYSSYADIGKSIGEQIVYECDNAVDKMYDEEGEVIEECEVDEYNKKHFWTVGNSPTVAKVAINPIHKHRIISAQMEVATDRVGALVNEIMEGFQSTYSNGTVAKFHELQQDFKMRIHENLHDWAQ